MEDKPGGKDHGKLHEAGPGDSPSPEQFSVGFNRWKSLIETGGPVSQDDLDEALRLEEINALECFELTRRLSRRHEEENEQLKNENIELKELAILDPLTGILNRRGLDKELTEAKERLKNTEENEKRKSNPKSALFFIIDLDNLKIIND